MGGVGRTVLSQVRRDSVRVNIILILCSRLSSDDESEDESVVYDVRKALERLVHVSESDTVFDISKSFVDSEPESVQSV